MSLGLFWLRHALYLLLRLNNKHLKVKTVQFLFWKKEINNGVRVINWTYQLSIKTVLLVNLLMCRYTVVVADNSVDRGWRAVSLAESNVLWDTLLSSSADISNKRVNARVVGLSEIFLLFGIDYALLNTHLIKLFEVSLRILGPALRVQFPWRGYDASVFLVTAISLSKCKAIRREVTSCGLRSAHIVLDKEEVFLVDDVFHSF